MKIIGVRSIRPEEDRHAGKGNSLAQVRQTTVTVEELKKFLEQLTAVSEATSQRLFEAMRTTKTHSFPDADGILRALSRAISRARSKSPGTALRAAALSIGNSATAADALCIWYVEPEGTVNGLIACKQQDGTFVVSRVSERITTMLGVPVPKEGEDEERGARI
jgi:hypothetical protein